VCWCVLCSFVPLALRIVFRDSESSSLSIPSDVSHPTPALESETPPRSSLPATSYSRVVAGFQGSKGSTTGHVVSGRMRRHSIVSIQPSSRKKRKKKSFQLGVSARVGSRPPAPAGRGHVTRKWNEIRKIDFQRPLIHSQRILVLTARSALRHFEPGPHPFLRRLRRGPAHRASKSRLFALARFVRMHGRNASRIGGDVWMGLTAS
jgi:hypothetical protein